MKKASFVYKSEKLIKISLEYDELNNIIHSIKITGDFFLYPEESLDKLETNLISTRLERNAIVQKIENCMNNSEAFGFDTKSMTEAILGCLR